jgi:chemotaxis protein CheD
MFNYVDSSIICMLRKFEQMGVERKEMEVRLLGGADVLERVKESTVSVGCKNIETALKIVREENLNLVASDLGGSQGRKVHFYTHSGKMLLTRISGMNHEATLWTRSESS